MKTKEKIQQEIIQEFDKTILDIQLYFNTPGIPIERNKDDIVKKVIFLRDIVMCRIFTQRFK